jgi:molybdenum cofactor cytidylyltransferase
MHKKIGASVLAAGAASRFGSSKQLAKVGSRTLIDIALDAMKTERVEETCVVLGCSYEAVASHLEARIQQRSQSFKILVNSEWKEGLSSSIRTATNFAIQQNATHLLLLTCDQPLVDSILVDRLLQIIENHSVKDQTINGQIVNDSAVDNQTINNQTINDRSINDRSINDKNAAVVACNYGDSVGIPAIIPANLFDELLRLSGDRGAKAVIQANKPILVDFPDGIHDIDYAEDLQKAAIQQRAIAP